MLTEALARRLEAVTPIIVTRGDVNLEPAIDALGVQPLIWDNSLAAADVMTFGAFQAMACVRTPLVYFQDDDVKVSEWRTLVSLWTPGRIICNMAPDFQTAYLNKLDKLIGHGAVFPTAMVALTFARYSRYFPSPDKVLYREANRIFTGLNADAIDVVYVGHENLPWASGLNRLWKQPDHALMHKTALERVGFILEAEKSTRS